MHSNYGNWNRESGIGPGLVTHYDEHYNVLNQSRDFDANGEYIKTWCPELTDLPIQYIHEPWTMPAAMQVKVGVAITQKHYPPAIDCMKYTSKDHYMVDELKNRRENKSTQNLPDYNLEVIGADKKEPEKVKQAETK